MQIDGITWHASVSDEAGFDAMKTLVTGTLGLTPGMEGPGFALLAMPNGTMLELYAESSQFLPPYRHFRGPNGRVYGIDEHQK